MLGDIVLDRAQACGPRVAEDFDGVRARAECERDEISQHATDRRAQRWIFLKVPGFGEDCEILPEMALCRLSGVE
jgi:hypothetical protein